MVKKSNRVYWDDDIITFVTDQIEAKMHKHCTIAVEDLSTHSITWQGDSVYVQKEAVLEDLGIFDNPDIFFK